MQRALGASGPLAGKKLVVTAGGTQEPLDPVRYIGNRSSGKMGYAIAEEAFYAGADVTLISGAASIKPPYGIEVVYVGTTREMEQAVRGAVADADALVMAAAVADYAPREVSEQKIKKSEGGLTIDLEQNPDILAGLSEMSLPNLVRVGFAAETQNLLDNAKQKLDKKKLDMIVANEAVASIGADSSVLLLVNRDGNVEDLPPMPKSESARVIVERLANLLRQKAGANGS